MDKKQNKKNKKNSASNTPPHKKDKNDRGWVDTVLYGTQKEQDERFNRIWDSV